MDNDHFKELAATIRRINQTLQPFRDLQAQMGVTLTSAYKVYNEHISDAIRPFAYAGIQLAATQNAMQKYILDNRPQIEAVLNLSRSVMAINAPAINILKIYHDELTKTLAIIPQNFFNNIDFDRIQMQIQNFNALALEMDGISIDEDYSIQEDELKNIRDIVIDVVSDDNAQVHELLNRLMQYAHDTVVPKLKAATFAIVMAIINYYIIAYISIHYPAVEVFKLLNLSYQQKIEVIDQSSQELVKQQSMEELSKYRLVCVVDLHVRSSPSIDAPIKSGLLLGDKVKILETNEDWVRIQWSNNEGELHKGWVKKRYLTEPKIDQPVEE